MNNTAQLKPLDNNSLLKQVLLNVDDDDDDDDDALIVVGPPGDKGERGAPGPSVSTHAL